MKYCKRIYELKTDNDLTQQEVAKILKTTKQNYSYYETGKRKLSIEDLEKLCRYYNVSADYIIGLTDEKKANWQTKNNITITGGKNKLNFE